MLRGTPLLAALLLAGGLAGCGRELPDEPAPTTPGAGIPMGAVGATGVAFDAPTTRPDPPAAKGKAGKPKAGAEPSEPPPDPFATPPDDDEEEPAPKPPPKGKGGKHGPKTHSPSETTL